MQIAFFYPRITITTKGKYTAIQNNAVEPLVKLVDDKTSEVRLNALKVGLDIHISGAAHCLKNTYPIVFISFCLFHLILTLK